MVDLRPILLAVGILLATLGCAMMLPALYDLALGQDEWPVFVASAVVTLFVGISLAAANQGRTDNLTIKQAFVLTTMSWVALTAFAALPIAWSKVDIGYTNAFFEAMSGITTTGATVLTDLDNSPPGLLLWRALLQWLGGIGIIVMAIAVLPMLQIGGMQLFRMETSDTSEKILPRATQIAGSIGLTYAVLSAACAICYVAAGMDLFDGIAHMMTTISTGGFSTHDASIAYFHSPAIEMVSVVFMIAGSLPFVLFVAAARGRADQLFQDQQVRVFLALVVIFSALAFLSQYLGAPGQVVAAEGAAAQAVVPQATQEELPQVILTSVFNTVSVMSGTGYATADYGKWSNFSIALFFFIMFVGGCAGSTTCGIKIFRLQVLFETVRQTVRTFIQPHGVFVARFNGRVMPENVPGAVISFLFLFFLCFGVIAFALSLFGLDTLTALSATAAALCNVGPGLGDIVGPKGNFASLPDAVKWILCLAMLLGRLELFTVLVMFSPAFWRD